MWQQPYFQPANAKRRRYNRRWNCNLFPFGESTMLVKHAAVYQGDRLIWRDVSVELDEHRGSVAVRNRGIPKPGNFRLELPDGRSHVMRSGIHFAVPHPPDGNTAYFTLNAIWKDAPQC